MVLVIEVARKDGRKKLMGVEREEGRRKARKGELDLRYQVGVRFFSFRALFFGRSFLVFVASSLDIAELGEREKKKSG